MPELKDAIPFPILEFNSILTRGFVLFRMSTGINLWRYKTSANQLVDMMIPAALSASKVCTAYDSFTLVQSSMVIEYDGANSLFEQSQSFFVTNS